MEINEKQGYNYLLFLTLFRIPLAITFLLLQAFLPWSSKLFVWGVILLAGIELSDLFDGILARRFKLVSELGATLDPFSDSISRILVYSGLAFSGLCYAYVPLIMAIRDVTVSYSRILLVSKSKTASAKRSGKIKAVVQSVAAYLLLSGPLYWQWTGKGTIFWISFIVAVITLFSSLEYVIAGLQTLKKRPGNKVD